MNPRDSDLRKTFLDMVCPLPDPFSTAEEQERFYHHDLPGMKRPELLRERERVRFRLVFDNKPPDWFGERLAALEEGLHDGR